ncbi:hypothetical protein KIPB_003019 [Kipferlia bialata]|uniref:Amino acid transporter transmembrane domain-containing protein n=1 Tax=Kipferlia bialata TaxID=797122 RepID=A0A9K3CTB2_9EUKA|nr:hypothetical protein KIPB_003019 [Kipferlia bialata]|eukprot:g3019.t1
MSVDIRDTAAPGERPERERGREGGSIEMPTHEGEGVRDVCDREAWDEAADEVTHTTKYSSVSQSTFNMSNSILGAGILSLAYGLAESGIFLGLFLTALCVILHRVSLRTIVRMTHITGCGTYQDLVRVLVGPQMASLVPLFGIAIYFGACIAYYMVAGDYLKEIFPSLSLFAAKIIMSLPMLGLSLLPSLERLSIVSLFALLACLASTIFVTGAFIVAAFKGELNPVWLPEDPVTAIGNTFALMSGAFAGENIIVILFTNLGGSASARLKQIRQVIDMALGFVCFLNTLMAASGSLMFGSSTMDNLLMNFPSTNILCNVVKVMMLVVLVCSYPLLMAVNVLSIGEIVDRKGDGVLSRRGTVTWLIVMYIFVVIIGSLADSISTILSLSFATAGSMMFFILPGFMALRLPRKGEAPVLGASALPPLEAVPGETEMERERRLDLQQRHNRTGTSSVLAVVGMLTDIDIVIQNSHVPVDPSLGAVSEVMGVVRDRVNSLVAPVGSLPDRETVPIQRRRGRASSTSNTKSPDISPGAKRGRHRSTSISLAQHWHKVEAEREREREEEEERVLQRLQQQQRERERGGESALSHVSLSPDTIEVDAVEAAVAVETDTFVEADVSVPSDAKDVLSLPVRVNAVAVVLIAVGAMNAFLKIKTFF